MERDPTINIFYMKEVTELEQQVLDEYVVISSDKTNLINQIESAIFDREYTGKGIHLNFKLELQELEPLVSQRKISLLPMR